MDNTRHYPGDHYWNHVLYSWALGLNHNSNSMDWKETFEDLWWGSFDNNGEKNSHEYEKMVSFIENLLEQERQKLGWKTHDCREMLSTEIENAVEQERKLLSAEANAMIFEDLPDKAPDVKDQDTLDDVTEYFQKVGSNHAVRHLLSIINKK